MHGYRTAFIDGVRQSERGRTEHGIESMDDGGFGTLAHPLARWSDTAGCPSCGSSLMRASICRPISVLDSDQLGMLGEFASVGKCHSASPWLRR